MLTELKVSNFAIIDNVHIVFHSGLNILSGETGSGKSILLKSLSLLMGDKASSESVRTGHEQAVVEGSFDLKKRKDIVARMAEMGLESEEDQLIIRRIVSAQGKNRVYINNAISTLSALQNLVAPLVEVTGYLTPLIEMTGQHENQNLLSKSYHLDLLDHYAETITSRKEYAELWAQSVKLASEIESLQESGRTRAQRLDFLKFQIQEIEEAALVPGDDVALEEAYKRIRNSVKIQSFLEGLGGTLSGEGDSIVASLKRIDGRSRDFANQESWMVPVLGPIREALALLDDAALATTRMLQNMNQESQDADAIETQLSQLRKLQKKYGSSVADILLQSEEMKKEALSLDSSEDRLIEAEKALKELQLKLKAKAEKLSSARLSELKNLEQGVQKELKELNMKDVVFRLVHEKLKVLSPLGIDQVEFMLQNRATDTPRPIAKFASGGELSRILLALKQIVGQGERPRTYLFDEVDTGVSGITAEKVGRKLKKISEGQQVICVTHLPQVAAFGDSHFSIEKKTVTGSPQTLIRELKAKDRVQEIARLVSGEKVGSAGLKHAEQLLKESRS